MHAIHEMLDQCVKQSCRAGWRSDLRCTCSSHHSALPLQVVDFEKQHGLRVLATTCLQPGTRNLAPAAYVTTTRLLAIAGERFLHPLSPCITAPRAPRVSQPQIDRSCGPGSRRCSGYYASAAFQPAQPARSMPCRMSGMSQSIMCAPGTGSALATVRRQSCSSGVTTLATLNHYTPSLSTTALTFDGSEKTGTPLLCQLIDGNAPNKLSLAEAAALAEAARYYLAEDIMQLLPAYLAPVLDPFRSVERPISGCEVCLETSVL